MWLVGEGDLLLIGATAGTIDDRVGRLAAGTTRGSVPVALTTVGVAPAAATFGLVSLFAGGPRELERNGAGAELQTDGRTALEFSAPRGICGKTTTNNAAEIRGLGGEPPAAVRQVLSRASDTDWATRGRMEIQAEAYALSYDAFAGALAINSRNADALAGLSDAAAGARRQPDARTLVEAIVAREPANAPARVELSRLLAAAGEFDKAVSVASDALRLAPEDPRAGEQLASIVADAGDGGRLGPLADSLAARFPDRPDPQYYRASALSEWKD